MEDRSPSAESADAFQLVRLGARLLAMPLASSSRSRPSPDVHAEDRAPPSTSSKERVATIPDASARASAPLPSAAFATVFFDARHFVVASLARVTREASSSAGEGVHPPSPEPRITLSTFIDGANWGEDFSFELPAIEFSIRERRPRFARNPSARCI